jgi:hypothetical protein
MQTEEMRLQKTFYPIHSTYWPKNKLQKCEGCEGKMSVVKGGSVEGTLVYVFSPYSEFEFSFPVTLCLPF